MAAPTNLTGQVLAGRYRIVRPIGAGGMGVVFEAVQLGLERRVAVKLVGRSFAHEADALARFRREAQAAAALGHPNIVQVSDFVDVGDGRPFLVMELLEGESLASIVAREGRMPPARVAFIAGQILSALSAAHAAGIVHRDIKPGNVVLVQTTALADFVKIVDFGIAKLYAPGGPQSQGATIIGTPSYMAPEQAMGLEVDGRTDLYGVAATMLHALTGAPPPKAPVPPVAMLAPWLPQGLAAVLDRALALDPAMRFRSADAMREALAPFTGGTGRGALMTSAPPTVTAPPPALAAPTVRDPTFSPPRAPARSRSGCVVAAIAGIFVLLALVVAGALAAFVFVRERDEKPTAAASAAASTTGLKRDEAPLPTIAPTAEPTAGPAPTRTGAPPIPVRVDAGVRPTLVDAGGGGAKKDRTYKFGWFRPSKVYTLTEVSQKLGTPAFSACIDRAREDAFSHFPPMFVEYDPNGIVRRVNFLDAGLQECARRAWIGIDLGKPPKGPGLLELQLWVTL